MDYSTEDVTLLVVFVNDILREVEKLSVDDKELREMVKGYPLNSPYSHLPIEVYNNMCAWVETRLGDDVLQNIAQNIGETVFEGLTANMIIDEDSSPLQIMEGLEIAADSMVSDPKHRGWEILENGPNSIRMRRTQTFNSRLQLGLIKGLIEKSGAKNVYVSYAKEIAQGADFDEYLITWE